MFGYFKMDKNSPEQLIQYYRKNYCYLCRALGKHYGACARFILSYDVAFFLILVSQDEYLQDIKKVTCVNRTKPMGMKLKGELAEKIASFHILLMAEKLEDDIKDEGKTIAKIAKSVLARPIKKAKKLQPLMWKIIHETYEELRAFEQKNASLEEIESCFARLMTDVATQCFALEDAKKIEYLRVATKWLYFIDAVDDLDDDIKEGTFNPLKKFGSFYELKNRNYCYISEHIRKMYQTIQREEETELGAAVLSRVLFSGIPSSTVSVLTKRR